ncbi:MULTISPECIES: DNA polymerase III subunit delta' [unclassified Rothia (in: high G+C Gram-positive bacteria)]|uniref:DNA polymerase III subunit delta' n=1 Tax=unclassified Rothia (in: high G+C Gram-positive bacteria) TaxID=2689056 RepID=UPI00195AF3C1|nr:MULTISPECIES: DNA polymerase III subunit delta' [unclassified Rothia (in: high G+C Gram-positive bacteria)]MBM7052239.1 DNA polymerase III subunit delta' [Rothia sp. ZJ1223]QRZ61345.1 DNA polymerase III subunit delta' [Rothia sp. ZJ932]
MSVWEKLVGQEAVVAQLQRAAQKERPTHAWLFSGSAGAGRDTAALAFAAALLCDNEGARGCGICKSCLTVLSGSHADLTHFRTQNLTIKIEEARELITKAQDRPSVGRWRVMIVEDANRMPERTSNVLLKAIEEPPPHTIWLLTAPSPSDVLVTIRSRCRPVTLRIPPVTAIADLLTNSYGVNSAEAEDVARISQGNIDTALRLSVSHDAADARARRDFVVQIPLRLRTISTAMDAADKLMEHATNEAEADASARNDAELSALRQALGIAEGERVTPAMRSQVRQLEEDHKRRAKRIQTDTLDRFLVDLQTFYRDVLTLQLATGSQLVNARFVPQLQQYAQQVAPERTMAHLELVSKTRRRITTNASAKLMLEALMTGLMNV